MTYTARLVVRSGGLPRDASRLSEEMAAARIVVLRQDASSKWTKLWPAAHTASQAAQADNSVGNVEIVE